MKRALRLITTALAAGVTFSLLWLPGVAHAGITVTGVD